MSDVKHTALPWQANYQGDPVLVGTSDRFVAMTLGCDDSIATGEDYANAEYIAKACNAYPALVEALTQLMRISELINSIQHAHNPLYPTLWAELDTATQNARAALAQAQGE